MIRFFRSKNTSRQVSTRRALKARRLNLEPLEERQLLSATTWVDDDFTAATPGWGITHFGNIQDGITNADPSGTVNVAVGEYYGTLSVNKDVDIVGAGQATYDGTGNWTGGTLVTRDPNVGGQTTNQVVHITADGVSMTDLTVDGRYGFDVVTEQATNYGIMVEASYGVGLTNLDVLDSTNNGIELNNADGAVLTNVSTERTTFAPAYYSDFNFGLRIVDSENVSVDGFTAENVNHGIVVFQGVNSGTLKDITVDGDNEAGSYGVGFYTSSTPGWWNPAWGDYEGDLTFTLEGSHDVSNVDNGVFISDQLPTKDINLNIDPGASFDFYSNVTNGVERVASGSVPNVDTVAADMGLTEKTVGPPDLYNYPAPTDVWVDGAWIGTAPGDDPDGSRPCHILWF